MKREIKYSGGCLTNLIFLVLAAAFTLERNNMAGIPEIFNSGVGGGAVNELSKILRAASKEIKQMVLHPTGTEGGQAFRRARAIQQIDQIDRLLSGAKRRSTIWANENALEAVKAGRRTANKQAVAAGIKGKDQVVQGSFELIDVRTAGVFARQIARDSGKALEALGDRGKQLIRETAQEGLSQSDISRILAHGVITGKPVETIRRLKDALEAVHGDRVSFLNKNGDEISFEVGYYAELVARTQTRMATVTARHERLQELDIDLVAIIGQSSCELLLGVPGPGLFAQRQEQQISGLRLAARRRRALPSHSAARARGHSSKIWLRTSSSTMRRSSTTRSSCWG
jgi:hypothetical protein